MTPLLLVPRGAEEQAVRRAAPGARVVAIRAGAAAGDLPAGLDGESVIVLGLCGALRTLRVGDVVIYSGVADEAGREAFDEARVAALHAVLPASVSVVACTANHVVTRAVERAALAAHYGADAVDMEGTHLARALAARNIASLVVRVVSDDPRFDLPPIEDAFDANGAIRPLHLAKAFASSPVAAARFVRDVRRSLAVLGATANVLAQAR